jgi:Domain of unknown function (DUF4350)
VVPIRKIVLLAIILAGLSCIPLYVHLTTSGTDYSRLNYNWNGTSLYLDRLQDQEAIMITDLSAIQGRTGSRLLLIAPDRTFTPEDLGTLRSYLAAGNTLVLADKTGAGNQVLGAVGVQARIIPGNLSSLDFYLWQRESGRFQPSSVIASVTHTDPLTRGIDLLYLNEPAAVEGGEVLAETSLMSWMDENGDRRIRTGEPLGSYSVFTRERVGAGTVYVFSDPSIFRNGMVELTGAENNTLLLSHLADAPVLLVDQSHSATGEEGVLVPLLAAARSTRAAAVLMVGMISMLVAYLFYRRVL